jgi:GTP:adenosylcobinamide-phosphate guanylyltransferase
MNMGLGKWLKVNGKKLLRWVLRTYQREIKAIVAQIIEDYIDKATVLSKAEVEKIKAKSPDIIKTVIERVIADRIDIASDIGKLQLNAIVNRYLDEAQKETM